MRSALRLIALKKEPYRSAEDTCDFEEVIGVYSHCPTFKFVNHLDGDADCLREKVGVEANEDSPRTNARADLSAQDRLPLKL